MKHVIRLAFVLIVMSLYPGPLRAQVCSEVVIPNMQALEDTTGKSKTPRHSTTYWPSFTVPMQIRNDLTYQWVSDISCGVFKPDPENAGYYATWEYVGHGKDARDSECVSPEVRGSSPTGTISLVVLYKNVPSVTCEYTGWGAGQGACTTLLPIKYGEGCEAGAPGGESSGGWIVTASVILALLLGGAFLLRRRQNSKDDGVRVYDEPKDSKKLGTCMTEKAEVTSLKAKLVQLQSEMAQMEAQLKDAQDTVTKETNEPDMFGHIVDALDANKVGGRTDAEKNADVIAEDIAELKKEIARTEEKLIVAERALEACLSKN